MRVVAIVLLLGERENDFAILAGRENDFIILHVKNMILLKEVALAFRF